MYSGRRTRNKNYNGENLRKYRAEKLKKGRRSIRKEKYKLSPKDLVKVEGLEGVYEVAGMQNKGSYVKLKEFKKPVKVEKVSIVNYMSGLSVA